MADVETATRQLLAQRFRWRINLGLEEGADTARSTVPPQEARDLDIPFSRRSGEADERPTRNACSVYCPVSPGDHVVGSDDKVIDPMHRAFRFDVRHD